MAGSTTKEDMIQAQVIRAARQLYQQHGLDKVTMDDVAKAIGKGKSSLYYYYKSKEEIFDAVIDVEIKDILAEIALAVGKVDTLEEKIQAFCTAKFRISRKRKATFNAMDMGSAEEMANYARNRQTAHKLFRKEEHAFFREILMSAMERKEISPIEEKELDMMIFVMLSSFRGLKREIVEENSNKHEEAAAKKVASLMINGLKK